jgi:transcription elongation factor GreA
MTRDGVRRIERELQELEHRRLPQLAELLREARNVAGDVADNGEYLGLLAEQERVHARIRDLRLQLGRAAVVEPQSDGRAGLGSWVVLRRGDGEEQERYQLVGQGEADPLRGRISIASPLGKALLGRRRGEHVEWVAPNRVRHAATLVAVD